MKVEYLKMIGHGTVGSDGIEEGIHLRWAFNYKLGFPDCFRLYRRESDIGNRYEFQLRDLPSNTLTLPYTAEIEHNTDLKIRLDFAEINGSEVDALTVQEVTITRGRTINVIPITNGELRISFSKPVSRIELGFLVNRKSNFQIIAQTEEGDYYPNAVLDTSTGFKNVSFDAPDTVGLVLQGSEINLAILAGWICTVKGEWEQINMDCGCGLPINQERTKYINESYPDFIGTDLAVALCRLGYRTLEESPFKLEDFLLLKAILIAMLPEGQIVPVGWTLFKSEEEESEEVEDEADLEFSKYDFLLTQSLQVFYAKILGLYFVDKDVKNNKYYDYQVTAEWPEWNKRRLEHEITFEDYESGHTFFPICKLDDNVVFRGAVRPEVVAEPFPVARTELGLRISTGAEFTTLNFVKPVTEVQLFMVNSGFDSGQIKITVEAYRNYLSAYVDKEELYLERGMVRLRAERIDSIKVYASDVVISRIHYDFEPYPVGLQSYIICGLEKQDHCLLGRPTGLKATFVPGGTVTDQDGNVTEKPYAVGLRWEANENPDARLISIAPVLYDIQKKLPTGDIEALTENSPVFVSPSVLNNEQRDIPLGWPEERQFYVDALEHKDKYSYRVAAQDLFGRKSRFTRFVTYTISNTPPPHPTDVTAQFLDYSTYNAEDDTFSDVTIKEEDKDWLRTNRRNAVVVRWKWPENLQLQAPDVDGFLVFYKQGWLNTYTGEITGDLVETTLIKTSLNLTQEELDKYKILNDSPEDLDVFEFRITLSLGERVRADGFRLCWLTQGNHSFLVLRSSGGNKPRISVLKMGGEVTYVPVKNSGFGIAVTGDKAHFIDYRNPKNWTDKSITHDEPKDLTPKTDPENEDYPIYREDYIVYIEDPPFPNPPIAAADKQKVRYAQIAVNSYVESVQGSVSPASTIMAIYRTAPPISASFAPVQGQQIQALKATPANVHGKSSFALRWRKEKTSVKHYVYRALDDTLFIVDNKIRQTRSASIYDGFKTSHSEFNSADVDVVKEISFESNPKLVSQNYAGLTPGQLQILASLPDNESAFTKLNDVAIDENDPVYQDRVTEIPDPMNGASYTPDPADVLLYVDATLDGRGSNRYFYALRSVDTNGVLSELSVATPPVEIPKTAPPPAPVITAVAGGENRITVRWAKNPGVEIAGYLLYRTQDKKKAGDWRRMGLVKANTSDIYTVQVGASLPGKEFEYIDETVIARQQYYYSLVAVGLDDSGKQLKSRMSAAKGGQAYDLTPPEPPQWDEENSGWVYVDDDGTIYEWDADLTGASNPQPATQLVWLEDARVSSVLIARSSALGGFSAVIANWVSGESLITGKRFHLDRLVALDQEYTYSGKSKSHADILSSGQTTIVIHPPSDPLNAARIRPNARRQR